MTSTRIPQRDGDTAAVTDIAAELRRLVRGPVWAPADDGYDLARTVWNGAVRHRPAVVVRCTDPTDVRTTLLAARSRDLPVSVRGGGHDWAGRAIRDGGVVIDLSALRTVRVDPTRAVARIEGGVLVGDLLDAAAAHGLVTPAGAVRGVGMTGMALAGGYGGLLGRFGLALDNLLSAEVVLADGSTVVAGPDGDRELHWALRGGGGNFGVVTSARFRLHPLGQVLGGMVIYPYDQGRQVLRGYQEVVASGPDELTVMAGLLTGPDGAPVVFLAPTWSGDPAAAETAVAPLTRLGTPLQTALQAMPYPELLRLFEAGSAAGNGYALDTHWLPELTDEAIAALLEAARGRTSPHSLLALHQFHGAACRVPEESTAFALRRPHLLAEVIAAWTPDDDGDRHRTWLREATAALAPGSLPGGYPNILSAADADRTEAGFGDHAERLRAAKRRYDPDGVFAAVAALAG